MSASSSIKWFLLQYDSVHGRMDGDITGGSRSSRLQCLLHFVRAVCKVCQASCCAYNTSLPCAGTSFAIFSSANCVMGVDVYVITATGTDPCRSTCPSQLLLNRTLLMQEMRKTCMLMARPSRSSLPCKYVRAGSSYAYSDLLPHTRPGTALLSCWQVLGV